EIEPDSEMEGLATALSRPSASEKAATASLPDSPSTSAPVERPLQRARRIEWSRKKTLAFASLAALLVIAVLAMRSAEGRDTRTGVAGNAVVRGSKIPPSAAREEYLSGINAWDDRSKEGNDKAVAHFRRATELDPEYAEAWAQLAEAYVRIGYFGYRPAAAMFPKAKAAALRSLQLDSTDASARTALASGLMWEHDFAGAEAEYRKAIAFDPKSAIAHQWYGVLLMILRRIPEAVAQEKIASDLEPLSLQIQNNYATFVNVSGDHAGALRQFQKTIGEEPDTAWVRRNPWVLSNMARTYADNGRYAEAVQMMTRALEIAPGSPRAVHDMAVIYDEMGRRDLARRAFAGADTSNDQYAAFRGMLYADQGSADSAFLWFDRQGTWGIQPMLALQADRDVDPMRNDPRFGALLRRLGIPTH
ncbi:MAG TPA: tetratricopeptide repeat protein, partial [Gemmatimonadaceae bacterium]